MSLSNAIGSLNDALFPTNPSKVTSERLGVFGGESTGFAHGVETLFAKSFYTNRAKPDEFGVSEGMKGIEVPRSIFNRYALFNFRGLYGGLTGNVSTGFFDQANNPLMGGADSKNVSTSKMMDFYNTNYPRNGYIL